VKHFLTLLILCSLGCSKRVDPKDYTFNVADLPGEIRFERIDQVTTGERLEGARYCKYFHIRGKISTAPVSTKIAVGSGAIVSSNHDLLEQTAFLGVYPEGRSFFSEIQKLLGNEVKFFRQNSGHYETYSSTDGTGIVVVIYAPEG